MKKITKIAIVLVLIGAVVAAGYFYWQYRKVVDVNNNEEEIALIKKISKIMLLPAGEMPTVATVTDKTKLENQMFFKNSENGDKVLIFSQTGKVILFRPSIEKIIEVASVQSITNSQATVTPTPEVKKVTVSIFNGSKIMGLTNKFDKQLLADFSSVEIGVKSAAGTTDYVDSVIIDVSGTNKDLVDSMAKKYNFKVETMPSTETNPQSDILIILGQNHP